MKFSVSFAMAHPDELAPLARAADELGYNAVVLPDSIFWSDECSTRYPYTPDGQRMWTAETPWVDPLLGVASMAAVTERVRFYTSVIKLPVRDPVLFARQLNSVAHLSQGRFGLGIGLGWLPEEFTWCGADWATRAPRFEEMITISRKLLTGEHVSHEGEHYRFGSICMSPPAPAMPIYLGGHAESALDRAARIADGWSSAMLTGEGLVAITRRLAELRAQHGRADQPFEVQGVVVDIYKPDGFAGLYEQGVTDIITMPWTMYGYGYADAPLEKKLEAMQRFADRVIRPTQALVG